MRTKIIPLVLCLLTVPVYAAVEDILQADRDFSDLSERQGIKVAFLHYLGEGAKVFEPDAKDGRAKYLGVPDDFSDQLTWDPLAGVMSADDALGLSTGYWTYTVAADGRQVHGHYLSVWQRSGNDWRVAYDSGAAHPEGHGPLTLSWPRLTPYADDAEHTVETALQSIAQTPSAFQWLADYSLLLQNGRAAQFATAAENNILGDCQGKVEIDGSHASGDASMVVAWGAINHPRQGQILCHFYDIWGHTGDGWKLLARLINPPIVAEPAE